MKVPLLDLSPQNAPLREELTAAFVRVLDSSQFILGEEVDSFEAEFAAAVGSQHAVAVSSGTDALLVSLMALNIGPGDEVICPSFTFFATAGSVARAGAIPVFVDSCSACFNLDPGLLEAAITPKTRAIIPVHLFGQAAAMDAVLDVAEKHGLAVLEDLAQAQGAEYGGCPLGTIGNVGAYSFFPAKNLGGFGDGGMMVTDDERLADQVRILRNHGMSPKYHHGVVGGNFRMDALQAALLRVKLRHFDRFVEERSKNAAYYADRLSQLDGVVEFPESTCAASEDLISDAKVVLPMVHAGNKPTWNQYTIRFREEGTREAMLKHFEESEIGSEVYYPVPLHEQPCFAVARESRTGLPVCEAAAREVLSIPIYPGLSAEMKDVVIEAVAGVLESA